MRHALGAVLSVLHDGMPRYIETVSYADKVLFMPICDGEIKKNNLLGVVDIVYVKPVINNQPFATPNGLNLATIFEIPAL